MKEKNNTQHHFSRRNFLAKSSMAAMGMLAVGPAGYASALDLLKKPNSKFSGVQIGVITYSYRSMAHDIHQLLKMIKDRGNNSVVLVEEAVEDYAGKRLKQDEWTE